MKKNWLRMFSLFALVCFISGCGISDKTLELAKKTEEGIGVAESKAVEKQKNYMAFKSNEKFSFFVPYSQSEKWEEKFVEATAEATRAHEVYKSQALPLIDNNDSDDENKLLIILAQVRKINTSIIDLASYPSRRMAFLEKMKAEANEIIGEARKNVDDINFLFTPLKTFTEKAKDDYPKKAEEIQKKFLPFSKMHDDASQALNSAEREYLKHKNEQEANYAIFGDSITLITKNLGEMTRLEKSYRDKIGELYRSYTKILSDMRVDYYVTVGRVSWDEFDDFEFENNYSYSPRKVEGDEYDYFANLGSDTSTASYGGLFGSSLTVNINQGMWDKLRINPTESFPSGDDGAEYWIEDLEPQPFHRYTIIENGKRSETDWEEVDEDEFDENSDNLGMEVESKPYGAFEEEKIEEASPPGMSCVGNPKYGEWKKDSSGNDFWSWYGKYAFFSNLFGNNQSYYYRNRWSDWDRNYRGREAYYGKNKDGSPIYGTYGSHVRTNTHFQGTTFAKSGGFRRPDASIRGAGPSGRAGGPGGGGK